ncbi:6-phospho-3-hexuloisomerase [Thalassobacillus pellis]|uniref:6-phospho-3-hexuloisomerase n=1 Tax=Thalassobacillus pellis TaxID=748008 RepID=UPI00196221F6|nr:6-phospho-3-hexuloisomerase [Thalassobacillus pellis]MBM7552014.1 6-phospho-3-hexuloisomerase [Thalassobacillus pellis]
MRKVIDTVSEEISKVLRLVDENEAIDLSEHLKNSKRIFITGEGRSGLMGKAIAMRLMHGGFEVYVTGETITPSIGESDLLVAISGSGTTSSIVQYAEKAKESGANVFLITTNPESKLAGLSEGVLTIPAATKKRKPNEPETIQPLGNQFDQSVHLLLDAVIIHTLNTDENGYKEMTERHANME